MVRILVAVATLTLLSGCSSPEDEAKIKAEAKAKAKRQQKIASDQARREAAWSKQNQIRRANEAEAQRRIDEAKAEFIRQYPYYPLAYRVESAVGGQMTEYMRIQGDVVNLSDSDLSLVYIDFDILDQQGRKVGTASDTISGLSAGQTWRFSATWRSYTVGIFGWKYSLSRLDCR